MHRIVPFIVATMTAFLLSACTAVSQSSDEESATTIKLTEENFSRAETAKNFRNWAARGANDGISHLRQLPPRGDAAPTIQMNDDTLYSVVITEAQNGKVTFIIPPSDVYLAVQVVNDGGHGEYYVVEDGTHTVSVASKHAFLIYRTGLEKGMDHAFTVQDTIPDHTFVFGTYEMKPYDYEEVQKWVERYRDETRDYVLEYTFPRNAEEITDLH